jgi:hypothetical protein
VGALPTLGSKKQSDAAKRGSNIQLSMFDTLNRQQQPYIQVGLRRHVAPQHVVRPRRRWWWHTGWRCTRAGASVSPDAERRHRSAHPLAGQPQGPSAQGMPQNMRLRQILALRAQNGDTEAARMLGQV